MTILKKKFNQQILPKIAETLKAIAHPLRLRILEILVKGGKSVTEIQKELDCKQAVVSQQLKIMKTAGVVIGLRKGHYTFYKIAHSGIISLLNCLLSCQKHCLSEIKHRQVASAK